MMPLNCDAGEDSWESLGQQGDQTVNPKGNHPWIFIGRTDAKAPIIWPPNAKSQLIGKDPDAGKVWGQEEKGVTEDKMAGWHHRLVGHEFGQTPGVGTGRPGVLQLMGSQRVRHNWATELTWIIFPIYTLYKLFSVHNTPDHSPFCRCICPIFFLTQTEY